MSAVDLLYSALTFMFEIKRQQILEYGNYFVVFFKLFFLAKKLFVAKI